MRALVPLGLAAALLFAAPAAASADVIFDPADADDLAATLAEATASQSVCYGWNVTVSDPIAGVSESVGSNFGAGRSITSGECQDTVEFSAYITYTSESSEAEDSATYDVTSSSGGPTRADLDALGLDMDGLTGENPDVVVGNAVTALPLLAADTGMAQPIAASPETGTAPADAQLTDSPGSDWWRNSGGMLLWGLALLAAGGLFTWWIVWVNRRRVAAERAANEKADRDARRRRRARGRRGSPAQQEPVPQYVPDPTPPTTPIPTQPAPKPEPEPETSPLPVPSATTSEPPAAEEPAPGEPTTGEKPTAGMEVAGVGEPSAEGEAARGPAAGTDAVEGSRAEKASAQDAADSQAGSAESAVGREAAAPGESAAEKETVREAAEPSAGSEKPTAGMQAAGAGEPSAEKASAQEAAEPSADGTAPAEAGGRKAEAAAPSEEDDKPSDQKDKE